MVNDLQTELETTVEAVPQRIRGSRTVVSIRLIVTTAVLVILATAVLAGGFVQERNTRRALTVELQTRLVLEARSLALAATSAFLTNFPELTLHPMIREKQDKQSELGLVVVVDSDGKTQGHAESRLLGAPFTFPKNLTPETPLVALDRGERVEANEHLLVAKAPVRHPGGQIMGVAAVGVHRSYLEDIIADARRQQMVVLAVVLALGLGVAFVLMNGLLRPIGILRAGLERIGRGDLDTPVQLRDRTEFGMLAETVNTMATKLKVAQQEMVEKERMATELDLAREIQNSLLPEARTEAGEFVIHGAHQAALEVGGDYYDVFLLPGNKVGVTIADVSGKGLAGCLVMSMLSALLRAFREDFDSPSELLVKLDERLTENLRRGSFVTMFYGILDPADGTLTYASAGHSPAMVYRRRTRTVERFETEGIPVGAMRGGMIRKTLEDSVVKLEAGDILIQYTDGINESFERTGEEQFGFDRMEEVIHQKAAEGCEALIDDMRDALARWQSGGARLDDETLLVVSRELTESMTGAGGFAEAELGAPELADRVVDIEDTAVERVIPVESAGRTDDMTGDYDADEPIDLEDTAVEGVETLEAEELAYPEASSFNSEETVVQSAESLEAEELAYPEATSFNSEETVVQNAETLEAEELAYPESTSFNSEETVVQSAETLEAEELAYPEATSFNPEETVVESVAARELEAPGREDLEEPVDAADAPGSVSSGVLPPLELVELSGQTDGPLEWLAEARDIGDHIQLRGDMSCLDGLRGWLALRSDLMILEERDLELLRSAIYEACANIVEHGYAEDPNKEFELWWVGKSTHPFAEGYFLIRDHGVAFTADNWTKSDFGDPETRRRGRGFGLDIIHRVMSEVQYRPQTTEGNLTLLVFKPGCISTEEGNLRHA